MVIDNQKLKSATQADLIAELSSIDEELSNESQPVSWARCKELLEYKKTIQLELRTRQKSDFIKISQNELLYTLPTKMGIPEGMTDVDEISDNCGTIDDKIKNVQTWSF